MPCKRAAGVVAGRGRRRVGCLPACSRCFAATGRRHVHLVQARRHRNIAGCIQAVPGRQALHHTGTMLHAVTCLTSSSKVYVLSQGIKSTQGKQQTEAERQRRESQPRHTTRPSHGRKKRREGYGGSWICHPQNVATRMVEGGTS